MLDGTFHYAQDLHVLGDGGNVTAIEVAFRNFSGRPRETWMRGRRHYQVVGNDWDAEGGGNHKLEGFHP